MTWPLILAICAAILLPGAIIAIGARPREEDLAAERKRRASTDAGYAGDGGGSHDSCLGGGGDCGGGD